MHHRRHLRFLLLTAAVAFAPLSAAQAQNIDAALERFKTLFKDQGIELEWSNANISGDDVVLEGVTIGTAEERIPFANIELEDISEDEEGYRIESISVAEFEVEGDAPAEGGEKFSISATGIGMQGVLLPNDNVRDNYGGFIFYENANLDDFRMFSDDLELFSMSNIAVAVTPSEDDTPMIYSGVVDSFSLDLSLAKDSEQWPIIQALGFERITGSMESTGTWNPKDGRLDLLRNTFTVDDAGTFGLAFDVSGYTPELIAALRDIQKKIAENPEENSETQGFAALGLMQQMNFHRAEISFEDDSLTNKVLELVAKMQSMKPGDIAAMAKGAVPFMAAQLGNQEFTSSATQAVSKFLDKPEVIRVVAEPADGVPFALIMAEGMSTPKNLLKTLNVTVSADKE